MHESWKPREFSTIRRPKYYDGPVRLTYGNGTRVGDWTKRRIWSAPALRRKQGDDGLEYSDNKPR